ncbi:hypothetical protein MtrunA17_Chr2g0305251 [Medicago truncatula]|uniref:Uncharacterized protein n=1 Tax=Medicago truncatula TaxID=3880 RepID=A0A396JC49_MEDTR|nr:hypothetical protein MtrunA17_Chr2g0305251 [Medicago truncatula]
MRLISKENYKKLSTYMKESDAVSAIMKDFPPICKQDPLDVQMHYIKNHFATTGIKISLRDVLETMFGGALPVAKSRKTKRKVISMDAYLEEAYEQTSKKAKKDKKKKSYSEQIAGSELPTIQEEAQDLNVEEILENRTRSSKEAATSQAALEQPAIPKKKRKHAIRKLRMAADASEEEAATELVSRELRKK